jgi:raffinose/stachyose/melibiose transport system permease protein
LAARSRASAGAMFIAPATAFFGVFLLFPVIAVIGLAFAEWTGFNVHQIHWAGTRNFSQLFHDAVFRQSLVHTLIFVVGSTLLLNLVGLGLAMLIHTRVQGHRFLQIAIVLPLGLSPVLTAILWQQILGPYGFVNELLVSTLHWRTQPIGFLGDPNLVMWTVIAAAVWQYAGYDMLLYYAGLQGLPKERMEAAAIDGAGAWSRLRYVVIPFLRPVIAIVIVLNLIGGWKVFDLIFVLTGGGPSHSTEVLSTYLYQQAFTFNSMGYASSIAVVIVVLAMISALIRGRIAGEVR